MNFANNLALEIFFCVMCFSLESYCYAYCSFAIVDLMWVPAFIFVCSYIFTNRNSGSVACCRTLVMDLKFPQNIAHIKKRTLSLFKKYLHSKLKILVISGIVLTTREALINGTYGTAYCNSV